MTGRVWTALKRQLRRLKRETWALYFAYRDPRCPWYARVLAALVVAYAFSPIDLIPDFIPVLGYLDDLLIVPLGVYLVCKMIPAQVLVDARVKSAALEDKPTNYPAAVAIVLIWLLVLYLVLRVILNN
jgi:uncharacterized membrane protein YkvA (DUF1232 family)